MPVTLKQLARDLKLHHSTVAYALTGKGTVKEATRQRVREAAAKSGYIPNGLARRMRARKSNVIGLIFPDVLSESSEFIQHAFGGINARGYEVQIALTESDSALEDKGLRFLMESRVDGLILQSGFHRWDDVPPIHTLRQLAEQNLPTILFGEPISGSPFSCVRWSAKKQAQVLTKHLLEAGHQRLAWLFPGTGSAADPRQPSLVEATRRALSAAKLDPTTLQLVFLPTAESPLADAGSRKPSPRADVARGRELMRLAMALDPRPNAVLCPHAATAIGAILEAQAMGLRVPEDVAVAAASDDAYGAASPVPLTHAGVSFQQAAQTSLDLLFDLINRHEERPAGPLDKPRQIELDTELVIAGSTAG